MKAHRRGIHRFLDAGRGVPGPGKENSPHCAPNCVVRLSHPEGIFQAQANTQEVSASSFGCDLRAISQPRRPGPAPPIIELSMPGHRRRKTQELAISSSRCFDRSHLLPIESHQRRHAHVYSVLA
jgi:hypothetical protein